MELLYKSDRVDIFFDPQRNILVQKWKDKRNSTGIIKEMDDEGDFAYTFDEIVKTQLYNNPEDDIEAELRFLLFQFYSIELPMA